MHFHSIYTSHVSPKIAPNTTTWWRKQLWWFSTNWWRSMESI